MLEVSTFRSLEDYLAVEKETGLRHEWFNGHIFAMAGASPVHNTVAGNAFASLHSQLRGRACLPYNSDQRVKIAETGMRTYPDVLVACPPHAWDDELPHTLLNPTVIIEVLSPSTENYDRGDKFAHYRLMPSLQDYLLVSSSRRRVEHFHRLGDGDWRLHIAESLDAEIVLETIGCRLSLRDLYERLEFDEEAQNSLSREIQSET